MTFVCSYLYMYLLAEVTVSLIIVLKSMGNSLLFNEFLLNKQFSGATSVLWNEELQCLLFWFMWRNLPFWTGKPKPLPRLLRASVPLCDGSIPHLYLDENSAYIGTAAAFSNTLTGRFQTKVMHW